MNSNLKSAVFLEFLGAECPFQQVVDTRHMMDSRLASDKKVLSTYSAMRKLRTSAQA
jgi:hypothetical protein